MPLTRFSLREISSRPSRAFLTFLSIAIGVGAVVAVLLATSTTRQAQRDILKAVSGKAELEIVSVAGNGFDYQILSDIRGLDGVKLAVPSISRFAVLFTGEEKARTQVIGIDPRIDQEVREYELVAGAQPTKLQEILLDDSFAVSMGVDVGSKVKLLARGGMTDFTVAGLVQPSGGSAVALTSAIYLVLPAAQDLFMTKGKIDQAQLLVSDGSSVAQVQERIAKDLPPGVIVRQPKNRSDMAQETMYATENGLLMAIAFAIIIAIFIIYNTFQMTVGERHKQLGILRAIGATRRQVAWMILQEALWVSLLGSIAGCLAGLWGASYLNQATELMLQVELPRVQVTLWPFVIAIAIGVAVSILGAALPARRASHVEPIEAMRAMEIRHNETIVAETKWWGLGTLVASGLLFIAYLAGILPVIGGDVVSVVLLLLGLVLLIPVILTPYSRWVSGVLGLWLGVEAELARKQLLRHIGRSTLTIGVLFIAIATSTGLAGNILDNVENVRGWYSSAIIGDFFIRASMPDLATGKAADIPENIGTELKKIEGITNLDSMRFANIQSGDDTLLLVVRDFVGSVEDFFDIDKGDDAAAVEGLKHRKVVVGSVIAQRRGLSPGDRISLETQNGPVELEIVATANDYIGGGLTVYLDRAFASELLGIEGSDAYIMKVDPAKQESVEAALVELCRENGLILQSYSDLVEVIDGMINGVIASLWLLLGLGCTIASMGLANTLTMNVLEQTREIGMLRVVAMTRQQVRRMIVAEAALIGLLGLVPGATIGILVQYVISLSSDVVLGHNVRFSFRPEIAIGCLACGLVIVLLASLMPAERAARLKLSSALHYE